MLQRPLIPFSLASVPFALLVLKFDFLCDDAFISFRYSRNLASGLGLRYNPGVEPPVEGYSEFLWVLWMAIMESSGIDVTIASRVTSVVCAVALLFFLTWFLQKRLALTTPRTAACALFFATLPPVAVWSTGGLATLPFGLVVFATFERLLGTPERPRAVQAGLLALFALLLRADGIVWASLILGLGAATALAGRDRKLLRATLTASALVLAGAVLYLAWRYRYYGDLLPMTARAKVALSPATLERGANYVLSFLLTFPSVALVLLVAPLLMRRDHRRLGMSSWLVAMGTLFYAILVGGDFMCMGRFLVPALPFVSVALGTSLSRVGEGRSSAGAFACVALLLLLSLLPAFNLHAVPEVLRRPFHFRWSNDTFVTEYEQWRLMKVLTERWFLLGKALEMHSAPGDSLVSRAIGAVGYYSGLFVYDQHGLVTREVALRKGPFQAPRSPGHDKFVPRDFFRERRPTFLVAKIMRLNPKNRKPRLQPARQGYRRETWPLRTEDGFPEGIGLRVLRRVDAQPKDPAEPRGRRD